MRIPDWLFGLMGSPGCGNAYAYPATTDYKSGYGCGRHEYGNESSEGWGDGTLLPYSDEITQLELLSMLAEDENT